MHLVIQVNLCLHTLLSFVCLLCLWTSVGWMELKKTRINPGQVAVSPPRAWGKSFQTVGRFLSGSGSQRWQKKHPRKPLFPGFCQHSPSTVSLLPLGRPFPPLLERQRAPHRRSRHPSSHQALGHEGSELWEAPESFPAGGSSTIQAPQYCGSTIRSQVWSIQMIYVGFFFTSWADNRDNLPSHPTAGANKSSFWWSYARSRPPRVLKGSKMVILVVFILALIKNGIFLIFSAFWVRLWWRRCKWWISNINFQDSWEAYRGGPMAASTVQVVDRLMAWTQHKHEWLFGRVKMICLSLVREASLASWPYGQGWKLLEKSWPNFWPRFRIWVRSPLMVT